MNLTRQQLINHCLDAIHAGKYLLVRVDGYPVGLNPRFAKQVQRRSDLDPQKEIIAQSIIRQCGINEYLTYKWRNSFTGKLMNLK